MHCHKSRCSFVELSKAISLPRLSFTASHAIQPQTKPYDRPNAAEKLDRARKLWGEANPITGTTAETYLRGRGITCSLPNNLRFHPSAFHVPTKSWCCAMVANVSTGGVHRTFFDRTGNRLSKDEKMMLGPCSGGAVSLYEGSGALVVCEGVETA